jgi:hypothetical protein
VITGRKCKVTVGDQVTVDAETVIASDNLKSLIVSFDAALWMGGGMYAGTMPLIFDAESYTYRELMTGTPVLVDWLCEKCNARFRGRNIYKLRGAMGLYVWDSDAANALVSARDPKDKAQHIPDAMLRRFLEVNSELDAPEHLDHVDPSTPGIVAQRFGGMFLLDGTYRAHKAVRDGVPFSAHVLSLDESDALMIREMSDHADMPAHVIAGELRGVLINNKHARECEAVIDCDDDPAKAEREIRAHLTADENARIKLNIVPRKR